MAFQVTDNVSDLVSRALWENQVGSLTGINIASTSWGRQGADEGTTHEREFVPSNVIDRGDDWDAGGYQPGVEFISDQAKVGEQPPWYEFNMSPFRLKFNGFKIPLLGVMSVAIEKTKSAGIIIYSLAYMALPTLAWFLGVDSSRFSTRHYFEWRPVPEAAEELERCSVCNGWNTTNHFADASEFKNNPFLRCPHLVESSNEPMFRSTWPAGSPNLYDNTCPWGTIDDFKQAMNYVVTCDHVEQAETATGAAHVPRTTLDGLYMHRPGEEWRARETARGLRCHTHYPATMHGWFPELLQGTVNPVGGMSNRTLGQFNRILIEWNKALLNFEQDEVVALTALSLSRLSVHKLVNYKVIVLYMEPGLPEAVRKKFDGEDLNHYTFFRVPPYGPGTRALASYRVFLAYFTGAPIRLIVVNQAMDVRERAYFDHLSTAPYSSASGAGGHLYPAYAGTLLVRGRHGIAPYFRSLKSFSRAGFLYGWDEIYPAYFQKNLCVCYKGLTTPSVMMGITFPQMRDPETGIMITNEADHKLDINIIRWSRQAVYWVNRVAGSNTDPGRLTFWHVWSDPRPILAQGSESKMKGDKQDRQWYKEYGPDDEAPPVKRVIAPGDHVLQELVSAVGGIALFTIGTTGDVLPFRALGKYIASFGVPVRLFVLNTKQEGKVLLDSAMGRRSDNEAVRIFNRCRTTALEQGTGASLYHAGLMWPDAPTLDLAPPVDFVLPKKVAGGWLMTLGAAILGVWNIPSAIIGPYPGPRILPTSHNGKDFLTMRQNKGTEKVGAVWGSDGTPALGYEDIPLVPDGDHLEIFRNYRTIVCHGGAGTVSTAAAAGCRVIVPAGGLDRARRNPYDAGLGLQPGADPDNIFLVLADQDSRFFAFWLRRNFWKPWKLWRFYGFPGLGWLGFRLAMLYFLYNSSFKASPISSEPLMVLASVLGYKPTTTLAFLALVIVTKGVDAVLEYLNISYMRILTSFAHYNWRMAISPFALYLAQRFNIGVGLLYSVLSPWLYKALSYMGQAWANLVLGCAPHIRADGEAHHPVYLELSVRTYMCFPVIHAALVCPARHQRFEGVTVAGLYIVRPSDGGIQSPFVFATSLTWDEVLKVPHYTGRYSLGWNCQTAIVMGLKHKLPSLGVGGIFLYGNAVLSAGVYTVGAALVTTMWSIVNMLPQNVDPATVRPSTFDIGGDVLSSLWNVMSVTGEWDPITVLEWWRRVYMPF